MGMFDDLVPKSKDGVPAIGVGMFDDLMPKKPKELEALPSVYSQFSRELQNPTGMAATLGASDAQLADIIQKQLGDKFIRRETVYKPGTAVGPGDKNPRDIPYEVIVTRGPNGEEQRGYVNKPGVDSEDVVRGVRGALPYAVTGGAAGAAARGVGLLGNAAAQGVTGVATSAAGDVLQSPLGSDQGIEVDKAVAMGLMGFGVPLASRAAGNLTKAIVDRHLPAAGPLKGVSRRAVDRITEAIDLDGNLTPQTARNFVQTVDPDQAMLGDMGRTLQTDTARLARVPGSSDIVNNALVDRATGAAGRIKGALNSNLGPERNLPQYIEQQAKAFNAKAGPHYDIFRNTQIKPTERLHSILDASKAAGAYDRALKKMLIKQIDPATPQNAGTFLDLIKRELDGMASQAKSAGNRTDANDFAGLARSLRNEVDSILSPGNPAQSPWAQGRAISGEGLEGREAADLGAKIFSGKKDPHAVQADLADLSQHGRELYREGARNDLRGVMGRSSSNFGPKGDAAARRALNSEFSRENVEQIAGPNAAKNITGRIDAENHMAELYDMARGNSITSTMEASKARWPTPTESAFASEAGKKGPIGLATEAVFKIGDALIGGRMKLAEARAALDGAKILTARGPQRDAYINALFKVMAAKKAGRITGQQYEAVVGRLLSAGRVPAYQAQSN